MTWTCLCGASNDGYFCHHCGQQHAISVDPPYYRRGSESGLKWLIGACSVLGFGLIGAILLPSNTHSQRSASAVATQSSPAPIQSPPLTSPITTGATPVEVDPHEQHLADLHEKRENLSFHLAMEIAVGKQLYKDAMESSANPISDAGEKQYLMEKMDEETAKCNQLAAELKDVDAEIAQENQQQSVSAETSRSPSQLLLPSNQAGTPTSGVLCNGAISVPQNGQITFNNLPGDRLHLTFDHDAWQPAIHRQSDGTQTLVMRSLKPGVQTVCDMRWETLP